MKEDVIKLITFTLAGEVFAIPVEEVERVLRFVEPAVVPDAPAAVMGVVEDAGRIVPVVDLRSRFSIEPQIGHSDRRIVIVQTAAGPVGVVVDSVLEVAARPSRTIQPPPSVLRGLPGRLLHGFVPSDGASPLIMILDANNVLSSTDRFAFERSLHEGSPHG